MITVLISKESDYQISLPKIQTEVSEFLRGHGAPADCQVDVSVVSEKTMLEVSNRYLKDHAVHDVLSFPTAELKKEFVNPPDTPHSLGEIVVCFQMATDEAKEEGMPVERKVIELIEHGALHLLGIHHE